MLLNKETKEKEKLIIYSKLANFSYIHLKTNNKENSNDKFEFQSFMCLYKLTLFSIVNFYNQKL